MSTVTVYPSVLKMLADHPAPDRETVWQSAAEVALTSGDLRLVTKLCDAMLARRPNHIDALYYRARLAMATQDSAAARPLLDRVLKSDPEHWAARYALGVLLAAQSTTLQQGLARSSEATTQGQSVLAQVRAGLSGSLSPVSAEPRPAATQAQWEQVYDDLLSKTSATLPDKYTDVSRELLVALLLLDALAQGGALGSARRLAHKLVSDHATLVKPRLYLADWYMAEGDIAAGTALLHDAKVNDPGGRVARRLSLPTLTVAYSAALPSEIETVLNALPADIRQVAHDLNGWQSPTPFDGSRIISKRTGTNRVVTPSPLVKDIQKELVALGNRLNLPKNTKTDVVAAEMVVTARAPWVKLYGVQTADTILQETATLVATINQTGRIHAHLVILDDLDSMKAWNATRVEPSHAASVKDAIDVIARRLEAEKEQPSYLLIVGGDAVVPMHRLPNPVDDHDPHVPSDNPYAADGDNYLLPTRAVGRLPHDRTTPDLIINQLKRLQAAWKAAATDSKAKWLSKVRGGSIKAGKGEAGGFAADVWSAAAKDVYKVLDSKGKMKLSPPVSEQQWAKDATTPLHFYYFNLHGVEENGNYYGQSSDPHADRDAMYPLALTPTQMTGLQMEKAVMFSEACYGANPKADSAESSMALAALKNGCWLFAGSTNTSYASFKPPLMAADLLAALFWKAISEDLPGGAALQQAKIELAQTIQVRGGYLDVEEQKALLSFVLYGDPALPLGQRPRYADPNALKQIAQKARGDGLYQIATKGIPQNNLDAKLLKAVRDYIQPYTGGAASTPTIHSRPVSVTDVPPGKMPFLSANATLPKQLRSQNQWHVTVAQPIANNGVVHRKVITLTLNEQGKVLKSHSSR